MNVICFGFTGSNGRRESQGSLSSGASLELATSGSGKNEVGQMHLIQADVGLSMIISILVNDQIYIFFVLKQPNQFIIMMMLLLKWLYYVVFLYIYFNLFQF